MENSFGSGKWQTALPFSPKGKTYNKIKESDN